MTEVGRFMNHNQMKMCLTLGFLGISKLLKLSVVVGSKSSVFSSINVCAPFLTIFGGTFGAVISLLSAKVGYGMLYNTGLPTLCAGVYWRVEHKLVRMGLPFLCMLLFWAQSGLTLAAAYPLLWIFPILVGLSGNNQIYARALGATLTAHAVGSVIWAWFVPLTHWQWFALVPVAALERIVIAIGMVWFNQLIGWMADSISLLRSSNTKKVC